MTTTIADKLLRLYVLVLWPLLTWRVVRDQQRARESLR